MLKPEELSAATTACLDNATSLIASAEAISHPRRLHISLHLATLALEEIGKCFMLRISNVDRGGEERGKRPSEWIDQHEKKLFWALWMFEFSSADETVARMQQALDLAAHLHDLRKRTLYVDPSFPDGRLSLEPTYVANIVRLARTRLDLERSAPEIQVEAALDSNLAWFFEATNDPERRPLIFSKASFDKQGEFRGDPQAWLAWIRHQFEEADRVSLELTRQEINRKSPEGADAEKDKWKLKIRLLSWSHTVRSKELVGWNKQFDKIQLFDAGSKRNELLATFVLPKKLVGEMVWHGGMQVSHLFLMALNIGTFGFFWWYLPRFTSRFYESVLDLETRCFIDLDRTPKLEPQWGHQILKASDLAAVSIIFTHLTRVIAEDERTLYTRYFRACALIAKSDIFLGFEINVLSDFQSVLKDSLRFYNDWSGDEAELTQSLSKVFTYRQSDVETFNHLRQLIEVGRVAAETGIAPRQVSVDEALQMKVFCDLYFRFKANETISSLTKDVMPT